MIDPDFEFRMHGASSLQQLLVASRLKPTEGLIPSVGSNLLDAEAPLTRWPSGLWSDFDTLHGGFSGMTVLAGPGGSGKSTIAMACALDNALDPDTLVVYFDRENTKGDQAERAARFFGGAELFRGNMLNLTLRFHWHRVHRGQPYEQLMQFVARRVLDHQRVLIVLDSATSIARGFPGRPLDNLSWLWQALDALVADSAGRIRVLALSELNGEGEVKGLEAIYAATMVLKLCAEPDHGDYVYRLRMLKNRNGPLVRDLGLHEVRSDICRLARFSPKHAHTDASEYDG